MTTRSPQPLPASANGAACRRSRGPFLAPLLLLFSAVILAADNSSAPAAAGKVNINQASATQIALLPRIGEKVAGRVLDYRKSHGPFARPEDLMEVKGIGEKLFTQLKPYVTLSGPTTLADKVSSKGTRGGSAGGRSARSARNSVPVGKGR